MSQDYSVFDRKLLRLRRDRAAAKLDDAGFLFRETAGRLGERLSETTRQFDLGVDIGCHGGEVAETLIGSSQVKHLVQCDLSPAMAKRAEKHTQKPTIAADEEFLPFANARLDLVISNLALHWANDLPGVLLQIRKALRPDGLFLGCLLGGETLRELRQCLMEAELAQAGGASPRVSPFADIRDMGGLMQRAGFALPMVDADTITVDYPHAGKLMRDLSNMGESNCVEKRKIGPLNRSVLGHAAALYQDRFARNDGRITATFQAIFLTGWAPDASQPAPLKPGQGQVSLVDFLTEDQKNEVP